MTASMSLRAHAAVALASICALANATPTITWAGGANPGACPDAEFGSRFESPSVDGLGPERDTAGAGDIAYVAIEHHGKGAAINAGGVRREPAAFRVAGEAVAARGVRPTAWTANPMPPAPHVSQPKSGLVSPAVPPRSEAVEAVVRVSFDDARNAEIEKPGSQSVAKPGAWIKIVSGVGLLYLMARRRAGLT